MIPISGPLPPQDRTEFLPDDYERLLRPVSYDRADAWWLQPSFGSEATDAALRTEHPWAEVSNGRVTAKLGIRVADLVAVNRKRLCGR